jgi:hypothetical protein
LAPYEAETREPCFKASTRLYLKKQKDWGVAQVVKCLPSIGLLISIPSTVKKKKTKTRIALTSYLIMY